MISSQTSRTAFTLTGTNQVLTFGFPIKAAEDIEVVSTTPLGVDTTLTLSTHYTVSVSAQTVTMVGGTVNNVVSVYRATPITQTTSPAFNSQFSSAGFEAALDRLVMQVQRIALEVARSLRLPNSNGALASLSKATRSSKLLGFDASGNLELSAYSPGAVVLPVSVANGGTGLTAIGTALQVLRVNAGATALEYAAPAAGGVTDVTGTAPIVSSGGATPAMSITAATTSVAGSLSAADKTKLDATSGTNTGDRLPEEVNVKDFGATGDGTTNDTTAIQNAVNSMAASSVINVTLVVQGTGYITIPTVTFSAPPSGVTATGTAQIIWLTGGPNGRVVTVIMTNPGSGYTSPPTVTISAPASGPTATAIAYLGKPGVIYFPKGNYYMDGGIGLGAHSNPIVGGLTFRGDGARLIQGAPSQSHFVVGELCGFFRFTGFIFDTVTTVRNTGMAARVRGSYVTFDNNTFLHISEFVVGFGDDATATRPARFGRFTDNTVKDCYGDGCHVTYGEDILIANNLFDGLGDDGVGIVNDHGGSQFPRRVTIEGNKFRNIEACGIRVAGAESVVVRGNDISITEESAIRVINYSGKNFFDVRVIGNTIDGVSLVGNAGLQHGIEVSNGDLCVVQGNIILGTVASTVYSASVTNLTRLHNTQAHDTAESIGGTTTLTGTVNTDLACPQGSSFAAIYLPPGVWAVRGTIAVRSSTGSSGSYYPVFYDGTTEYGRGATTACLADGSVRVQISCDAVIANTAAINLLYFRLKNGGGGLTLDAGSTFGPNSYITATRLA